YFAADGCDLVDAFDTARTAADWVRRERKPALLHLRTVRLMGHAGSDYEPAYRRPADILADYERDPVVNTAKLLVAHGILTPAEVVQRYEAKRAEVMELARQVSDYPQLDSATAVMQPLRDTLDEARAVSVAAPGEPGGEPLTLALAINAALQNVLQDHPE
nr:thiamine pyrophosphate-dependent enzyme [Streptomyces sp. DSM 41633]